MTREYFYHNDGDCYGYREGCHMVVYRWCSRCSGANPRILLRDDRCKRNEAGMCGWCVEDLRGAVTVVEPENAGAVSYATAQRGALSGT